MFQKPNIILGILFSILFIFYSWYRGKKDGFDMEKLFDILLFSLALGLGGFFVFYKIYESLRLYNPLSFLLGPTIDISLIFFSLSLFLSSVYIMSRIKKWSIYRLYDLIFMSFVISISISGLLFGIYLRNISLGILTAILLIVFNIFISLKDRYIPSGYFACCVLVFIGLGFYIYERNLYNLIYTFIFLCGAGYLLYSRLNRKTL